jgi:hypothetical protein
VPGARELPPVCVLNEDHPEGISLNQLAAAGKPAPATVPVSIPSGDGRPPAVQVQLVAHGRPEIVSEFAAVHRPGDDSRTAGCSKRPGH